MGHNTSNNSLDDIENRSGVLNHTSYSLQDTSGLHNEPSGLSDVEMLDPNVTDLLDDPYRLRLGRNNNYHGFDQSFGDSWIYPANYPMRQYQFTITEAALFKNTLVVLPTGLGKTFIAAVVMYNIYRWYPTGKVIFMAPTRLLVNQQIEACHHIMGIPKLDTAVVTGEQPRNKRSDLWQTKRVFYATPQVVLADLEAQTFPVQQVRLVVIDEAHKAKGRYAYTDVIRRIAERNQYFRVLALSATPGRTLVDVVEVIKNLLISHIEVRWDNSIDVFPYVFRKDVRTIVIPIGQTIARIRKELLQLINPYMLRLLEANVFMQYPSNITSGMLVMKQKQFQEKALQQRPPNYSAIIADFGVCISMYHALHLLVKHGIRTFINFFDGGAGTNVQEKYFVAKDRQIKTFLDQLRIEFHHQEHQSISTDSAIITGNDDIDFGHPKYRILEQQLMTFFKQFPNSKAIVFCEFRDSVAMIKRMLSNNQPVIRPNCIVGQGGSNGVRVAQQKQIDVMRHFRSGTYNTLIATCVAEEGIDVGEVDLIVCFDIAKNPMRFVQRIGRTGRQRVGQVLMLVTEGEEHDTLKQVLASKDKINQQLTRSKEILRVLYPNSPRLVPAGLQPECVKMYINVSDEQATVRNPCSDSSDEAGRNATKNSDRKRRYTRRDNYATEAIDPPAKRNKATTKTRDVRDFFPPQRNDPTDVLNASERDMFVVQSPNQKRDDSINRSHASKASIPIDKSIRQGRTDAQVAIDALLQPLIRHYQQMRRQKFLYDHKLLNGLRMPNKASMPINAPVLDDPLDLPELVPHEGSRADVSQAVEENLTTDKSISNLFDLSHCLMSESTSIGTYPLEGTCNPSKKPNASGKKAGVSTLENPKKHSAAPKDLCNSPLFLAFNRSVQKRKTSEVLETSALASNTAAPITSLNEPRSSVSRSMVLEYFRLKRLEDIFDDVSSDELVPEKVTTINDQKQGGERTLFKETTISRNLFGVPKPMQTTNVPVKHVTKAVDDVSDRTNLEARPAKQHKTSVTMLKSDSNISKKNIDLGTAELVFQDDSDNDFKRDNDIIDRTFDGIFGRKTRQTTSRRIDSSSETNKDETFDGIIRRKTRKPTSRRIDSSTETDDDETFDGKTQNINSMCRLIGTAASNEDEVDDSFHSAVEVRSTNASRRRNQNKQRKTKPAVRGFFDSQAAISDDGNDGDDDAESDSTASLADFVTDTVDEKCTVDMRAVYLQSLRSPLVRHGGFKMPARAPEGLMLHDTDVQYSEENVFDKSDVNSFGSFINDTDVLYPGENVLDSPDADAFCSFINESMNGSETALEMKEILLKERRRQKNITQSHQQPSRGKQKLRCRILSISSDSD